MYLEHQFKRLAIASLLVLASNLLYGQKMDSVIRKVETSLASAQLASNTYPLFVHTDKTLYTNNEIIWFAAYVLGATERHSSAGNTLSVALLLENDRTIQLSEQYIMQNGLSIGSILLPDTIPPGSYQILAYTNAQDKNGMPKYTFNKSITIKTTVDQTFSAQLRLQDSLSANGDNIHYLLTVANLPKSRSGKYPPTEVEYSLSEKKTVKTKTNEDGKLLISIPIEKLSDSSDISIKATVRFEKNTKHLSAVYHLPAKKTLSVRFYPEGGYLTENLTCKVGLETKDSFGNPVTVKAALCIDGIPIDTVETSSSGMGTFLVKAAKNHIISIKILENDLYRGIVYRLPEVISDLPSLIIEEGVITDTLKLNLKYKISKDFIIVIHNKGKIYKNFQIGTNVNGRSIIIPLSELPRGISALGVYDLNGKSLLERLFFAKYPASEEITTELDKNIYGTREKVTLKLKLTNNDYPSEIPAVVSVAVVQSNRLEAVNNKDIESYFYLENELGKLPFESFGRPFKNKNYLENLLLIKGWRKFLWDNPGTGTQLKENTDLLAYKGRITHFGKPLKKAITLTNKRDSLFNIINTDATGEFQLRHEDLIIPSAKRVTLFVNQKDWQNYNILVSNPYHRMDSSILRNLVIDHNKPSKFVQNTSSLNYSGDDNAIKLNQVTINLRRDNLLYGKRRVNECGDYVCIMGYLNCPNPKHISDPMNTYPAVGRSYTAFKTIDGKSIQYAVTYKGCADISNSYAMDGIKISREFYVEDYSQNKIQEIDYVSTAFWAPLVEPTSKEHLILTFFTSDLKGDFKVIIQGKIGENLISGETSYVVK